MKTPINYFSDEWQAIKERVEAAIKSERQRLESSNVPEEMYRAQGALRALQIVIKEEKVKEQQSS